MRRFLLLALMVTASTPFSVRAEVDFERYHVLLGPAERQTVLTGSLTGGDTADLVVVEGGGRLHFQLRWDLTGDVKRFDVLMSDDGGANWNPYFETTYSRVVAED